MNEQSKDTIKAVIDVENEIQLRIDEEKKKAAKWVQEVQEKADLKIQKQLDKLSATSKEESAFAEDNAKIEAARIVRQAEDVEDRVKKIDDLTLREIIRPYITELIWGRLDDNPYVQDRDRRSQEPEDGSP